MSAVRILVTGAGGMVGRKLVQSLERDGSVGGQPIDAVLGVDAIAAPGVEVVDIAAPGAAEGLLGSRPDVIFHLAGIVSGEAETDFEKGYRVNFDGSRLLLDAIRLIGNGYRPRFVFTSTIAVFGAPFPESIGDEFLTAPLTSYGTQKAMTELLLADYTRRGFLDGIGLRLPTICVRPGAANLAASGFFSNIIREPLAGRAAVLPVPDDVRHWHASPRAAVGFLLHAAALDGRLLGDRRTLTMPGLSVTVAEQIEALRVAAGDEAVRLIRREPDEAIMRIVAGWPRRFDARRAEELGFRAETDFAQIIRVHLEDELGG